MLTIQDEWGLNKNSMRNVFINLMVNALHNRMSEKGKENQVGSEVIVNKGAKHENSSGTLEKL